RTVLLHLREKASQVFSVLSGTHSLSSALLSALDKTVVHEGSQVHVLQAWIAFRQIHEIRAQISQLCVGIGVKRFNIDPIIQIEHGAIIGSEPPAHDL